MLTNVVSNAKQTSDGHGAIEIALTQTDNSVIVAVRDIVRGIPASLLDHLFHPSQSSQPGGLGDRALSQWKKIVEAHGGSVRLESQEGEGTPVRIELPLRGEKNSDSSALFGHRSVL